MESAPTGTDSGPILSAGRVQPRDQPALLRSYPTELAARFPASAGLFHRHPGLDLLPDRLGDHRIHQGRRGPPPGWVATDITGRLYTATAVGRTVSGVGASVEQVAKSFGPTSSHTVAVATRVESAENNKCRLTPQERPALAASVDRADKITYDWAGLPSNRRRITVGGMPESEPSHSHRLLSRSTEPQHSHQTRRSTKPQKRPSQQRRRHAGFFMSPSGYCHTRGAFYKLTEPLDQDCWTCCGQTTKHAPGCIR
jgi:hypothetical protein